MIYFTTMQFFSHFSLGGCLGGEISASVVPAEWPFSQLENKVKASYELLSLMDFFKFCYLYNSCPVHCSRQHGWMIFRGEQGSRISSKTLDLVLDILSSALRGKKAKFALAPEYEVTRGIWQWKSLSGDDADLPPHPLIVG